MYIIAQGICNVKKGSDQREVGYGIVAFQCVGAAENEQRTQGLNYDLQDNAFFSEARNRLQNNIFAEGK